MISPRFVAATVPPAADSATLTRASGCPPRCPFCRFAPPLGPSRGHGTPRGAHVTTAPALTRQAECGGRVAVSAALHPLEHVPAVRSRRQMRDRGVGVDVDAQRHVARVEQEHGRGQRGVGEVLVEPSLRPHGALSAVVLGDPEPAVPVVTDGAGPDPTVRRCRPLTTCDQNSSSARAGTGPVIARTRRSRASVRSSATPGAPWTSARVDPRRARRGRSRPTA
jgi:hypothetical protein